MVRPWSKLVADIPCSSRLRVDPGDVYSQRRLLGSRLSPRHQRWRRGLVVEDVRPPCDLLTSRRERRSRIDEVGIGPGADDPGSAGGLVPPEEQVVGAFQGHEAARMPRGAEDLARIRN